MSARTATTKREFAFHPGWRKVGAVLDLISILKDIEDRKRFIDTHALRANPLDVAVNLHAIHIEVIGMQRDLSKMQMHLNRLLGQTEQELYQEQETGDIMGGNGQQKVKLPKRSKPRPRPRPKYRGQKAKAKG